VERRPREKRKSRRTWCSWANQFGSRTLFGRESWNRQVGAG
jgi:hypothetical protein